MIIKKALAVFFAAMLLLTASACKVESKGDKLAKEGAIAYTEGDYETALEKLTAAEAAGLNNYNEVDLKQFLGSTYLKMGDADKAIYYYTQVTDSLSFEMTPYLNLGVAQKAAGLTDEAMESYKKAQKFDTGGKASAYLYLSIGSLYIEKNEPVYAIDALDTAKERDPEFADIYAYLAIAYAQMYDFENSDINYKKAEELGYKNLDEIKAQIDKFKK
jgi:tetratricopeptide (TPR) repeat protein